MIKWFWIAVPLEVFFAIVLEAFLPMVNNVILFQRAECKYHIFHPRSVRHFLSNAFMYFYIGVLFPIQPIVGSLVQRCSLVRHKSSLNDFSCTLLVAVLC